MGITIDLLPIIGLGIAMHPMAPAIEIVIGPFVIVIGDIDKFDEQRDDD